jgi:Ca-activated chloride channel homolog
MTFLEPVAGIAVLSLVAIVALYFLKARRPARAVSSTLWWRPVILDRQAAVPWQRLRLSWLLALQAMAAILVIGALLRPALVSAEALAGQTIVVIDNSETMQATDAAPSRFAVAVADARALVNRLGPHARMTLIATDPDSGPASLEVTTNPEVIASTVGQRQPLLQALAQLKPTDGQADLQDALQLAVAAAGPKTSGTRLVILSDGITEPLTEPVTLPFPVQYRRIGVGSENSAITSLTVVPGVTGDSAVAHLQDFGQAPAHFTVEMFADGRLTDAQAAALPPGGGQDVTFAVPRGTNYVRVTLLPHDDLAADDSAVAVASPPRKVQVLLVTNGDVFLQKALELRPDVALTTEAPGAWRQSQASNPAVDLFVFDGFVPAVLPTRSPYLVVGPPPDRRLGSGRPVVPGPLLPAEANDPLLYDVDLSDVDVDATADLQGSTFGTVVIGSPAGPVLMVRDGSATEPPAAVLGVYLHDSDLVLRTAFPILVNHLSEFLAPDAVPALSQTPGTPVTLAPGPGAREVLVTTPEGGTDVLADGRGSLAGSGGTLLFTGTNEVGLYKVTLLGPGQARQESYIAVNAPAVPIAPQQQLDVTGTAGKAVASTALYQGLWTILAVAALVVLALEWLVYHRAR